MKGGEFLDQSTDCQLSEELVNGSVGITFVHLPILYHVTFTRGDAILGYM
jgi:hypothetical protein